MLPDLRNSRTFSSVNDSQYTVYHIGLLKQPLLVYVAFYTEQFLCNFYCDIYQIFNAIVLYNIYNIIRSTLLPIPSAFTHCQS